MKKEHPLPGRQYQLTGGTGEKCISNGNTWKESEVIKKGDKVINKLYELLKIELEYIIKSIKKRPKITRNNYGDYMNWIVKLNKDTKLNYKIIAALLIKAGGNKQGINDAMKIINQ